MWKLLEKENTDTEPFLSPIEDVPEKNKRLQKHHTSKKIYVVHAVIFTANIILAAILLSRMSLLSSETSSHGISKPKGFFVAVDAYSLYTVFAKDAIRYKKTNFLSSAETGLTGPPSPEMDTAWDRLLDDASIRLTTNEMSQFNSSSIDLQESQGKLAWLEISHQAHCVVSHPLLYNFFRSLILKPRQNYIRKALYRSYYYADLAEQDWQALIMPHVGMNSIQINGDKGHADDYPFRSLPK
jgi:hypothetical protein